MPSDIVSLLVADHQDLRRRLGTFATADQVGRSRSFRQLADTLVRHEVAEEMVLYPVVHMEPGGTAIARARMAEQSETAAVMAARWKP